jgi:hypothetical protein
MFFIDRRWTIGAVLHPGGLTCLVRELVKMIRIKCSIYLKGKQKPNTCIERACECGSSFSDGDGILFRISNGFLWKVVHEKNRN